MRALSAGDCAQAYAQLSPAYRERTTLAAFGAEHCAPADVTPVTFHSLALVAYEGALWVEPAAGVPAEESFEARGATEALRRFAVAAQEGRFGDAHQMLSAGLRSRWTPERLARDFARGGALAQERVAAILAAGPVQVQGEVAHAGPVRMVREGTEWKVAALHSARAEPAGGQPR